MNCWWIGSGESLCWKCRGWERGMGELATTNHLKGAILLQCKPFTSREDQGLNWLSWEQKWWQAYQENTDLVFKKKLKVSPLPLHTLPTPRRPLPAPPPPCSGRSYKLWMWNISRRDLGSRKFEGVKCNEHKSKADVLKKHLINLSSTYLQFVGFPEGPGMGTPSRRGRAPPSYLGFRDPLTS